jgi:hypothetical protein
MVQVIHRADQAAVTAEVQAAVVTAHHPTVDQEVLVSLREVQVVVEALTPEVQAAAEAPPLVVPVVVLEVVLEVEVEVTDDNELDINNQNLKSIKIKA